MRKNAVRYLVVLGLAVLVWQLMPAARPASSSAVTVGGASAAPVARLTDDTAQVHFAVAGMTCGSCATTAQVVLNRIEGIYRSEVSYDSARAVVWYDPSRVSPPAMITALREMTGYEASVAAGGAE